MAYNGFTRPTIDEIKERILSNINNNIPGVDARIRYTPLNVLATAFTGAVHEQYGFLQWGLKQTNLIEAENENLDAFGGRIWGINRKIAAYATGSVTFSGTNGTLIPENTFIQSATGIQYKTISAVTITSGTALANITALITGIQGNQMNGTILTLSSPISNINQNVTVQSLSGGTDQEDDDSYRQRILNRIHQAPHGGNKSDYINWSLEVPGVTRAWVTPLGRGAGTVDVRFVMDDTYTNGIPLAGDVAIVQAYLSDDIRRPITADVKVYAPIAVSLPITISGLTPNNSTTQANINAELQDLFLSKSEPGVTFRRSWIWDAISNADGVDHFQLDAPLTDTPYTAGQMPVLGTVTIS